MALVVADRVQETTTTIGTGTYTLAGAKDGFQSFAAVGDGNTTYYACTDGTDYEVGIGTYTASGTTLARTTIIESSNSDAAVSWSSGDKDIFVTLPASKATVLDASGDLTLTGASYNAVWDKSQDALHFNDRATLSFGGGSTAPDMLIEHNSVLNLNRIRGSDITIQDYDGSNIAVFQEDAGAALYHNGSLKAEIVSTGIDVTGAISATGQISGGSLDIDNIGINGGTITGQTGSMSLSGNVTVENGTLTAQDDVTFTGASYNAVWDKSDNALEFADNAKAAFGTGSDLKIYHGGSFTLINNVSASNTPLIIGNDGDDQQIRIRTKKNSESTTTNIFIADGATGEAQLLHLGSEKLATKSTGVDVVSGDIRFGGSADEKVGVASSRTFLTGNLGSQLRAGNNTKVAATTTGVELTGTVNVNGAYTLPTSDGTNGQVLTSDGAGSVSFAGVGTTTTTAGESATTRYIPFVDSSTGTSNETVRVDPALSFVNNSAAFTGDHKLTVGQGSGSVPVTIMLDGNNNGGNYTPELKFYDGDTAAGTDQKMGRITFQSADTAANGLARIEANVKGGQDPNDGSRIIFSTTDDGGTYAERLRITEGGALQVGTAYTLPTSDGSANQVLTTDGSGAVTFADVVSASSNTGTGNFIGGTNAGTSLASGGEKNTLLGQEAGNSITTGDRNVAVGYTALDAVTTHLGNIGIGYFAGRYIEGDLNVVIGYQAMLGVSGSTTGSSNIAIGSSAAGGLTTGSGNIAIGSGASENLSTQSNSIAIGTNAAKYTTDSNNISIGYNSMGGYSSTANSNYRNLIIGHEAARSHDTGENTYIGYQAGYRRINGNKHTAIGYQSQYGSADNTTYAGNTSVGYKTLYAVTTGADNVAVGRDALLDNTTGNRNIGVGALAGENITTGYENIAIGHEALKTATTDIRNTAVGYQALYSTEANESTAFGWQALREASSGSANTAVGAHALSTVSTGYYNTAVGQGAGDNLTTGYNNIAIGYGADASSATVNNEVTLGNSNISSFRIPGISLSADSTSLSLSSALYATGNIGRDSTDYISFTDNTQLDVYINGSNEFRFEADGDFHADGNIVAQSTTIASDVSLKENIQPVAGLKSVMALDGVSFDWKRDGKKSAGVIAQQVQKIMPEAVTEVKAMDGSKHLSVNYNALTSVLVEAIKELKAEIEELKR
jgi:hypothetical protein